MPSSTHPNIHIIGAGLAGLSAAVALVQAGHHVCLYEASARAGGRCRSYHDAKLDCLLDNGNHLLIKANRAVWDYLARIDAEDTLCAIGNSYPMMDLAHGQRWTVRPPCLPSSAEDVKLVLGLIRPNEKRTVAELKSTGGLLYERVIKPLCISALNTQPEDASAAMLAHVIKRAFVWPGNAHAFVPKVNLHESFVAPALTLLQEAGTHIYYRKSIKRLHHDAARITQLQIADASRKVSEQQCVLLATPAINAQELWPELAIPETYETIVNVHYKCDTPAGSPSLMGMIRGQTDWVFVKQGIVSTTTSAANHLHTQSAEAIAEQCWQDVSRALAIDSPMPAHRVIREKRATFACTTQLDGKRPSTTTRMDNLFIAGDYTDTGLPATMESAVQSGLDAAQAISDFYG